MALAKSRRELKHQELKLIDSFGDEVLLKIRSTKPGADQTLLDIAVDNSVDLPHSCGGMGSCGTCRVRLSVTSGPCPERNEIELEMAIERGFAVDERLSCQLQIPTEEFSWTAVSLGSADEDW